MDRHVSNIDNTRVLLVMTMMALKTVLMIDDESLLMGLMLVTVTMKMMSIKVKATITVISIMSLIVIVLQ